MKHYILTLEYQLFRLKEFLFVQGYILEEGSRPATGKSSNDGKSFVHFLLFFQVLLPASSLLQMSTVREACCKFLMRQLHPTNCLGIRSFAGNKYFKKCDSLIKISFIDTHACKELHKRSHKFALQNFQEVMNTEEFLLLPFSEVNILN